MLASLCNIFIFATVNISFGSEKHIIYAQGKAEKKTSHVANALPYYLFCIIVPKTLSLCCSKVKSRHFSYQTKCSAYCLRWETRTISFTNCL